MLCAGLNFGLPVAPSAPHSIPESRTSGNCRQKGQGVQITATPFLDRTVSLSPDYSPAAPIEQGRYRSFGHFKSPVTRPKEPNAIKTELYGRLPKIV